MSAGPSGKGGGRRRTSLSRGHRFANVRRIIRCWVAADGHGERDHRSPMKCLIRLDPPRCYRLQYLASLPVQCVDADLFGAAPFGPLRAVHLNSILMNRIAAYARHLLMVCAFMTMSIAGCASDGGPSGGIEAALTLDPDALVTPFAETGSSLSVPASIRLRACPGQTRSSRSTSPPRKAPTLSTRSPR
jgi:hypothetical protein